MLESSFSVILPCLLIKDKYTWCHCITGVTEVKLSFNL